jgi:hypothetical protein
MSSKVDKLKKRHSRAKQAYHAYQSVLRDAYTYALPDKGYFDTLSGGKRTTRIYDSTAILGLGVYADKVQQQLVPPWREWFKLIPGSEIDDETADAVQPDLDKITDVLYDHINHSNFNTKINEAFQDVGISTGILTCEEGDGIESSLTFNAISVEDVAMEHSQTGIVENIFKSFSMPIREIEEVIRGAKLTPKLKKMLSDDALAEIDLVEAIVKNEKAKYDHVVYWEEEDEIIYEVEDDTNPYIVFRERVTSKGIYGLGRIIQLLYDIKVLNKISEMDLQNAGLAIGGVWTATDDGVLNPYTVRIAPGTVIPVSSNSNQNPSLRPLDVGSNFQIAQLKIEQKQDLINKTLFNMSLGEVSRTPVRTLGENEMRSIDQAQVTNAAFSRFQTELLERLIKRIVDVLQKAGKIKPIIVDGKEVTIKFTSPLAKQQDQLDTNTLVEFAQTLAATGIPLETVGAKIKFEDVPVFIAKNVGVPAELIRTPEEEMQYSMQQQQAAQLAAQQGMPSE